MKVLSPLDTEHELILVPRFYPIGDITLNLSNEEKTEELTYTITPDISNGFMTLEFEQEFIDKSNYRITILKNTEIVYRGKLFITDQVTQEYKITKDVFTL